MFHNKNNKLNQEELNQLIEFITKPFNENLFCDSYLICLNTEDRFSRQEEIKQMIVEHGFSLNQFSAHLYLINSQNNTLYYRYMQNGKLHAEEKITANKASNLTELIIKLKPTGFQNLSWLSPNRIADLLSTFTSHTRWTDENLIQGKILFKRLLATDPLMLFNLLSSDPYISANLLLVDLAYKMNYLNSLYLFYRLFEKELDQIIHHCIYDLTDLENCLKIFPHYEKQIMAHIFAYGNSIDYAEKIIKNTFEATPLGKALREEDKREFIYQKCPKYLDEFVHYIKNPPVAMKYGLK